VGGEPEVIADALNGRGGTWSGDDVIVFAPSTNTGLLRVAATGGAGAATPVTQVAAGQGSHRWPQFLPDGRRFIFFAANGAPATRGEYVGSLDGGEPKRVLLSQSAAAYLPPGYLLTVSQDVLTARPFDLARLVARDDVVTVAQPVGSDMNVARGAFSVSEAGIVAHRSAGAIRRQFVWVDHAGKTGSAFMPPDEKGGLTAPELSRDGLRVAFARNDTGNSDVWVTELASGISSRFTSDGSINQSPVWAPDGDGRIAFRSSRSGKYGIFVKPLNGGDNELALLTGGADKMPLDWSADGQFLIYSMQDDKNGSDLWTLRLSDRQALPFAHTPFDEGQGQFSPNHQWVAYASTENGPREIYIRRFPGEEGKSQQVSTAGGAQPRWRHDGRELYYVALDGQLMAVKVTMGPDARTLTTGTPTPLFPIHLATGGNIPNAGFSSKAQYAVARDGRFLVNINVDDPTPSPISVVLNWEALVKRK
jgi:Tol biopolymer transport system component